MLWVHSTMLLVAWLSIMSRADVKASWRSCGLCGLAFSCISIECTYFFNARHITSRLISHLLVDNREKTKVWGNHVIACRKPMIHWYVMLNRGGGFGVVS